MVEGLIGMKIGMTQFFDNEGNVVPVTIIKVGPCTVVQKKTKKRDGYSALQLGLVEEKAAKKLSKPRLGHLKKSNAPPTKLLREFRFDEAVEVKEGDQFFVDIFQEGEKVHVVGTSKGKGFAGVVKRWGFKGGKASHGSMFHRAPGSIGASAFPSRVVKGKKLPGHMGNARVSMRNLTVMQADKENNLLVVKGPVPGAEGGYLLIKRAEFLAEPQPIRKEKREEKTEAKKEEKVEGKKEEKIEAEKEEKIEGKKEEKAEAKTEERVESKKEEKKEENKEEKKDEKKEAKKE